MGYALLFIMLHNLLVCRTKSKNGPSCATWPVDKVASSCKLPDLLDHGVNNGVGATPIQAQWIKLDLFTT